MPSACWPAGSRTSPGYFARRGRQPESDGFATVSTTAVETGAPVIDGALSWFDCAVEDILPGGDHEILVGRVVAAGGRSGEPLVYWGGDYRALTPPSSRPDELDNAADGLAVAFHLLGVEAAEMLEAQATVEPALAALAARRGTADRLGSARPARRPVRSRGRRSGSLQPAGPGVPRRHRRGRRQPSPAGQPGQPRTGPVRPLRRSRQSTVGAGRRRRPPPAPGCPPAWRGRRGGRDDQPSRPSSVRSSRFPDAPAVPHVPATLPTGITDAYDRTHVC